MNSRALIPLLAAIAFIALRSDAHASNTVTVLQFGGSNYSSTVQFGTTTNTATTLQFGSVNQASTSQTGAVSPLTNNSLVIGQGGNASTASLNLAGATQIGGSNGGVIGQIGSVNSAAIGQFGLLNGATVLQASP